MHATCTKASLARTLDRLKLWHLDLHTRYFSYRQACTGICDVTSWESQLALFALGIKTFKNIDIVLPNAGVAEIGRFDQRLEEEYGVAQDKPVKPNLKTLDIDLTGVLYTTRIALWYFYNDKRQDPGLRSIAFTGSMSSFYGANMGVMYGASKR